MKKTARRMLVIVFLAVMFLCGVALEEKESGQGPTLVVSVVEAPPGDGGCPSCGQVLPCTREGG